MYKIPFNRPGLQGNELEYIRDAIEQGQISSDGIYTKRCHQLLEEQLGAVKALLTPSCTHALEMAALLLDFQPGDEVILPSFTFVSTVNAFVLRGAQPVFIDIRPDTLNLDESLLEGLITDKTKAIVPVHYGGVACEMTPIMQTAAAHGIEVVEDNAHGLFGKYRGTHLGTFGSLAALSFHETKNFSCGEGGALLINDTRFCERAEFIRDKGTDRSRFMLGQVDKYTWVDVGSSYAPPDLLAAFLYAQFEARDRIQTARRRIWDTYHTRLASWAEAKAVTLPTVPAHCEPAYHLYSMLLPTPEARDTFIAHLKSHGILGVFHYLPLHLSSMGRRLGGKEGSCPVTEDISPRLVRLPFYNDMREEEQDSVIQAVQTFEPSFK